MWQGEDAVKIRYGKQVGAALVEPIFPGGRLTGGAVPGLAGVVQRDLGVAGIAAVQMSAEHGSAALQDVPRRIELMRSDGVGAIVFGPVLSEHVRYPQLGSLLHAQRSDRQSKGLTTERRCSLVT